MNQKPDDRTCRLVPKKIVLGLRCHQRMNTLISSWGSITDKVMEMRGSRKFADDLFTHVSPWNDAVGAWVSNPQKDISLRLTPSDLIFAMGNYWDKDAALNFEKAFEIGKTILLAVTDELPVVIVRRVGLVAEYRARIGKNPSEFLFQKSKIKMPPNPAAFMLRFESRRFDNPSKPANDLHSVDFRNIMFTFYDSAIDESPDTESVNANIDVQKYYWPPLAKDYGTAMSKHFRYFQEEVKAFKTNAKAYGLIAAED